MLTTNQERAIKEVMDILGSIDDSDMGLSIYRVCQRRLAEVLGVDLKPYRLLKEEVIRPLHCPEQYDI